MTQDVFCLKPEDTVAKAKGVFQENNFHHLLVTNGDKLAGVISDRDILRAYSACNEADAKAGKLDKQNLGQVMSKKPITITPETSVACAVIFLLENNISCLPVVSNNNVVQGIITWKDLLQYYVFES